MCPHPESGKFYGKKAIPLAVQPVQGMSLLSDAVLVIVIESEKCDLLLPSTLRMKLPADYDYVHHLWEC